MYYDNTRPGNLSAGNSVSNAPVAIIDNVKSTFSILLQTRCSRQSPPRNALIARINRRLTSIMIRDGSLNEAAMGKPKYHE